MEGEGEEKCHIEMMKGGRGKEGGRKGGKEEEEIDGPRGRCGKDVTRKSRKSRDRGSSTLLAGLLAPLFLWWREGAKEPAEQHGFCDWEAGH